MADLTDIQAAETVKIVGSSSSGVEATPVESTVNGDLTVADIVDTGGVHGAVSVSTTAVAARVGGSNLAARKNLTLFNNGTATVYWGYANTVTSSTGTPLMRNQFLTGDFGPNTTIFLIAASGSHDIRVTEGA